MVEVKRGCVLQKKVLPCRGLVGGGRLGGYRSFPPWHALCDVCAEENGGYLFVVGRFGRPHFCFLLRFRLEPQDTFLYRPAWVDEAW